MRTSSYVPRAQKFLYKGGMREDRDARAIRPVGVEPGFHRLSEGSVLYRAGGTVVLCTASIDASVPEFLVGRGKGWITAEYQMPPRANPKKRESRDGRDRPLGGRAREIQRLNLARSEEHTSELQSLTNLVCRLLLEKKKKKK